VSSLTLFDIYDYDQKARVPKCVKVGDIVNAKLEDYFYLALVQ